MHSECIPQKRAAKGWGAGIQEFPMIQVLQEHLPTHFIYFFQQGSLSDSWFPRHLQSFHSPMMAHNISFYTKQAVLGCSICVSRFGALFFFFEDPTFEHGPLHLKSCFLWSFHVMFWCLMSWNFEHSNFVYECVILELWYLETKHLSFEMSGCFVFGFCFWVSICLVWNCNLWVLGAWVWKFGVAILELSEKWKNT